MQNQLIAIIYVLNLISYYLRYFILILTSLLILTMSKEENNQPTGQPM